MARLRLTLFTILTVAILAVASYPIFQRQILPSAYATSVNISLVASVNGWNYSLPSGKNPTITVTDTEVVNIQLTTGDSNNHQFYVDEDRNGLADCNFRDLCSPPFSSSLPANYGWNSGVIGPGAYNYYDAYNQAATNGTLIVQSEAPDFSISAGPSTLTILQGSSQTSTIIVTSKNNFSGKVSLNDQLTSNGPTISLNPLTVNIPSGGSQSSTLTVSTTPATSPGDYTITITGNATSTTGQLAHSLAITLRVSPPPTTSPGIPVLSTFLFGAVAAAILAVSLVILVVRRRSTRQ